MVVMSLFPLLLRRKKIKYKKTALSATMRTLVTARIVGCSGYWARRMGQLAYLGIPHAPFLLRGWFSRKMGLKVNGVVGARSCERYKGCCVPDYIWPLKNPYIIDLGT